MGLVDTYIVADGRVILGIESGVRLGAFHGQKQCRELGFDQVSKGWEAEEDGEESEDAHFDV